MYMYYVNMILGQQMNVCMYSIYVCYVCTVYMYASKCIHVCMYMYVCKCMYVLSMYA